MYSEIEWKFARKVLLTLKKYKENPKRQPDVRNSIDYNIALMFNKKILIQNVGKY